MAKSKNGELEMVKNRIATLTDNEIESLQDVLWQMFCE